MNKIKINQKELTLEECLNNLSKEDFQLVYEELLEDYELIEKKNKKDKINQIAEILISNITNLAIMFTDYEVNGIKKLMKNDDSEILDYCIANKIVFKIDNQYIIPKEFKSIIEESTKEEIYNEKIAIAIHFYLTANGVLSINKLRELLYGTDLEVTNKKILTIVKEKQYIKKGNLIYLNEVALSVDKTINLNQEKEHQEYKVFNLEEMFYIVITENLEERYGEQLIKILSKKVKEEEILFPLVATILDIIKIGYDFEDEVNQLLSEYHVKLTKKEQEKFETAINEYNHQVPLWLENGYSHCEIDDEFEEDYFNEDFPNSLKERYEGENLFETILTKEEQIIAYINVYIFLNGVMEIDILKNILEKEHNYNVSKQKIISLVNTIEDLEIYGKYVKVVGIEKEEIDYLLKYKEVVGKYKIIDDIEKVIDNQNEIIEDFNKLGNKYNLDDDVIIQLNSLMYLGELPKEFLDMYFEEENIKISKDKIKNLAKDLKIIYNKMPLWTLNGYKASEYNYSKIKKEKIGRNDLCTCGSGKKYKKCCGK